MAEADVMKKIQALEYLIGDEGSESEFYPHLLNEGINALQVFPDGVLKKLLTQTIRAAIAAGVPTKAPEPQEQEEGVTVRVVHEAPKAPRAIGEPAVQLRKSRKAVPTPDGHILPGYLAAPLLGVTRDVYYGTEAWRLDNEILMTERCRKWTAILRSYARAPQQVRDLYAFLKEEMGDVRDDTQAYKLATEFMETRQVPKPYRPPSRRFGLDQVRNPNRLAEDQPEA